MRPSSEMGIYKANQNVVSVFKLAKIHYLTTCQLKASLKKTFVILNVQVLKMFLLNTAKSPIRRAVTK